MKVIKNINNNVALCLVAFGRGIGFARPPYEIDLKLVTRTYYDINETYIQMIKDISPQIIDISTKVIDYARMILENQINSNIVFTLADHIQFAIKRTKENMNISLPLFQDIQFLYEKEMELGWKALEIIKKEMNVYLPKEEAAYIALHIINSEKDGTVKKPVKLDDDIINEITSMIEKDLNLKINNEGFNYSRFVSHMHYLLKRGKKNELIETENYKLFETLKNTYPQIAECAENICQYLKENMNWDLTQEENIYLMLHINRLCAREDCYQ